MVNDKVSASASVHNRGEEDHKQNAALISVPIYLLARFLLLPPGIKTVDAHVSHYDECVVMKIVGDGLPPHFEGAQLIKLNPIWRETKDATSGRITVELESFGL